MYGPLPRTKWPTLLKRITIVFSDKSLYFEPVGFLLTKTKDIRTINGV